MRDSKASWDKKAPHYARFKQDKISVLHSAVLELAHCCGVDFNGARLLDVGCGTGVFSLQLAPFLAQLDALDISSAMLDILRFDFNTLATNCTLQTHCSTFTEFIPKHYDIALSTLSPAINSLEDFAKFNKCADTKIYASWSAHRSSSVMDGVFAYFGRSNWICALSSLDEFLRANKITARTQDVTERRTLVKNYADALNDVLWHLELNDFNSDNEAKQWCENYLSNLADARGLIKDEVITRSKIYIWK